MTRAVPSTAATGVASGHRPVLFDFNGVLVDDEAIHFEAFRQVAAIHGLPLDERSYTERYLGFDDAGAFRALWSDHGRTLDDAELARLIDAKRPIYMHHAHDRLRIFPGAVALVERRAAIAPIGVVSGALRHEIVWALDRMGVRSLIRFVIAAEDTQRCKPDPEGYERGVRELERLVAAGAPALRPVAVEDSLAGIQAARSAGLPCVAVTHSYPRDALLAAGASVVVDTLDEITDGQLDAPDLG
jgi:HAD superfamily hydrolase (TIGR01509 family)